MLLITTEAAAKNVRAGDNYLIDVQSEPPVTEDELAGFDASFHTAQKAEAGLHSVVAENFLRVHYKRSELNRIPEAEVVKIANGLGIDALVSDLKSKTIARILELQHD